MRAILLQKIPRFSDELLFDIFHQQPQQIRLDWRNWGDSVERMVAEELHRRGLI